MWRNELLRHQLKHPCNKNAAENNISIDEKRKEKSQNDFYFYEFLKRKRKEHKTVEDALKLSKNPTRCWLPYLLYRRRGIKFT